MEPDEADHLSAPVAGQLTVDEQTAAGGFFTADPAYDASASETTYRDDAGKWAPVSLTVGRSTQQIGKIAQADLARDAGPAVGAFLRAAADVFESNQLAGDDGGDR